MNLGTSQLTGRFVTESIASEILKVNVDPHVIFKRAVIDSREVTEGDLFVALPGNRVNGHDFVKEAINNGAAAAVIQEPNQAFANLPTILVKQSLTALQKLARAWRAHLQVEVIAITGSVGKTTTKRLTSWVLGQYFSTSSNPRNYNNEISVPLCLLEIKPESQKAVIEMGMYEIGDIQFLCQIAKPQVGVVLNVGPVHLARAGSLQNIQKAKSELPESIDTGGFTVLNLDDPNVWKMKDTTNGTIISYSALGNSNADMYASDIVELPTGKIQFAINYDNKKIFTQLDTLGIHLVENALAAAAVGLTVNLSLEQVCAALSTAPNVDRVKKLILQDGSVLLDDTYNSQPKSLAAILRVLKRTQGYRVALLADMLELGELSDSEHELAGKLAADSLDHLVTLGGAAKIMAAAAAKNGIKKIDIAHSNDEAIDYIVKAAKTKSTILIKGSQAFGLSNLIPKIISDYGDTIERSGRLE